MIYFCINDYVWFLVLSCNELCAAMEKQHKKENIFFIKYCMYFDQNVRCKLMFPALKTFHTKANNPLLFGDSTHKLFRFRIRGPKFTIG